MEIASGEQLRHLSEHIKNKLQGVIVSGAENVIEYSLFCAHFQLCAPAGELRVSRQYGKCVTGEVKFGHNIYESFGSIFKNLTDFRLCEKSGVFLIEVILTEIG